MKLIKINLLGKEEIAIIINSNDGILTYLSEDGIVHEVEEARIIENIEIKKLNSKEELYVKAFLIALREYKLAKERISNFVKIVYDTEITKDDPLKLNHVQELLTNRAFKNLFLLQNSGVISVGLDSTLTVNGVSRPLKKQDAVALSRVLNIETQNNAEIFLKELEIAISTDNYSEYENNQTLQNIQNKLKEDVNSIGNFVGQIFSNVNNKNKTNENNDEIK